MRLIAACAATALLAGCGGEDNAPSARSETQSQATPAAAAPVVGAPASATLRPGLWRTVITGPVGEPETQEKCVTAADAQEMAANPFTGMDGTEGCGDVKVSREGGALVARASCAAGGATSTLESRATGDFQNRYVADITMRVGGPQPSEMRFKMDSTRVGAC